MRQVLTRPFPVILALLCTAILAACSRQSPPLRGTITDAYTGQPINAAEVVIGGTKLTTSASGDFTTTAWSKQDKLEVTAPGYEPVSMSLETPPPVGQTESQTVTLSAALRPNTLAGTVTDSFSGQPLAGALVEVVGTSAISATTGTDGRYALAGVPESVSLKVSLADYDSTTAEVKRATSHDLAMRPNVVSGVVKDQISGQPVAGATVKAGSLSVTTGADGSYRLAGVPADVQQVEVSATGYATFSQAVGNTTQLDAALRSDTLNATLVDKATGKPIPNATIIATTSLPGKDVAFTRIDNSTDGRFSLSGLPETGYVQVLAPGYSKAVLEIKAGAIGEKIELEPFSSKALYVKTSVAAWQPERLQEFFDVIDRTEVNSLVIDLKSDNLEDLGLIYYQSNVPIIKELGTSKDYMDIRAILAEAKKRNVYTIARVHIFAHDNLLARTKPEWAAQDTRTGKEFYADWDIAWLDPWNRNVWDYNIQLGVEAAQLGFDEVQFDYIRFPNDAKDIEYMKLSKPHDPEKDAQAMYENIAEFMKTAHRAINGAGAFFSVDVFGYAAWAPQTIIGQNLSLMAPHADYVCPMVYPSHFYNNELGFDNAAAHPYEIITESMKRGSVLVEGKRAKLRPWLQDFTLIWVPKDQIVRYGVKEVRAQIDAADNYPGVVGWALWSADNLYTYDALKPEE